MIDDEFIDSHSVKKVHLDFTCKFTSLLFGKDLAACIWEAKLAISLKVSPDLFLVKGNIINYQLKKKGTLQ